MGVLYVLGKAIGLKDQSVRRSWFSWRAAMRSLGSRAYDVRTEGAGRESGT